jgi:zinc/manganese transport system substrate-binding protein
MNRLLVGALALAMLALAGPSGAAGRLQIVASFSVLGDMVREIAGGAADVTSLVGPDGDAHAFDPTPVDARKVAAADLLVVNGLGLEGWLDRVTAAAGYKSPIVVASAGITPRSMVETQGSQAGRTVPDPHAWQDLGLGRRYVANIAQALIARDPADEGLYAANRDRYLAALSEEDQAVRAAIAAVPPAKRRVITSHDAFGYFGAAYGVVFLAPEGLSTEAEPSAGALAGLIDQIRSEKIKALFVENITDPRLVETIARETGAEVGGALFSDALSKPDGPAPTYLAMFRNNVPKLVKGMERNDPPVN